MAPGPAAGDEDGARAELLRPVLGDGCGHMTAMDVVSLAAEGRVAHDALVDLLARWPYGPRVRRFAPPRVLSSPDSLDAVDAAFFDARLLTESEYDAILSAVLDGRGSDAPPQTPSEPTTETNPRPGTGFSRHSGE
ncbi:hypothetical protein [Microbacterium sp. 10M-3C3]|uniref:hypothetical protein n=1 Tax=Microbacterium sp. 10M-3C3 TaxID=2483401 RepID=UPI000F641A3A|nr:hypothetical protein [Microbacterium sp. 10M-3C3]